MYEFLLVVFLLISIALIGLVMLQQGKGADMGASFGAGASATLFGSSGSGNFMTRLTGILAAAFFILSLVLGNIDIKKGQKGSQWDDLSHPEKVEVKKSPEKAIEPVDKAKSMPNTDVPQ